MTEPATDVPQPARKRRRWLRRNAIDVGDVAVQVFSVVVGILLALLINEWAMRRQQQATVDDAMRAIRAELAANRVALRNDAAAMYAVAGEMMASAKNRNLPPRSCFLWGEFSLPGLTITDAAYQAAVSTQAFMHMPFAQTQQIAEIYASQHNSEGARSTITNNMLIAGPQPLEVCVAGILNLGQIDAGISARYTHLIGADNVGWAKSPPNPLAK